MTKQIKLVGTQLPNGAYIEGICDMGETGVILAKYERPIAQKWVTWDFYFGKLNSTSNGHYFENRKEAAEDFAKRIAEAI